MARAEFRERPSRETGERSNLISPTHVRLWQTTVCQSLIFLLLECTAAVKCSIHEVIDVKIETTIV